MTTITITENHPNWKLYSQLRKCGEITASKDGRHFGLNCSQCCTIFAWRNIGEFLGHLHEEHNSALFSATTKSREQKINKRKLCTTPASPLVESEIATSIKIDPLEDFCVGAQQDEIDVDSAPPPSESEPKVDGIFDKKLPSEELPEKVFESCCESENEQSRSENENDDLGDFKMDLLADENRPVLSYIIAVHQEHAILWDRENACFQMFRKKWKIYDEMIEEIQTRFKLTLTRTNIRNAFGNLRKIYTEQLLEEQWGQRQRRPNNVGQTEATQLWCFEQLEFLRSSELADNTALVYPIGEQEILAEIYKLYPALWNLDCDESHNRARQLADTIQVQLLVNEKLGLNMTLKQLRARILRMRKTLRKERRNRLNCERTKEKFEPQHATLYAKLEYLEPYIGPFRCDQCSAEILQYYAFQRHVAAHAGRLQYACRYCRKDFKYFASLEMHMRRHTGVKPFVCSYCGMRFVGATDLRTHTSLHTNKKKFVCHICGLAFRTSSSLFSHNASAHQPKRFRFQCLQCPRKYTTKVSLNEHVNSQHLQVRAALCRVCGKGFYGAKTLRQHMQLHDAVMKYECDLCEKKFAQCAGLSSHRRTQHKIAELSQIQTFAET